MTPQEEQIELNLKCIDFDKIRSVMEHLGWTWNGEERVPSKKELIVAAKACMENACYSENGYSKNGGFETTIIEGTIEIKFILDRSNPLKQLFG